MALVIISSKKNPIGNIWIKNVKFFKIIIFLPDGYFVLVGYILLRLTRTLFNF